MSRPSCTPLYSYIPFKLKLVPCNDFCFYISKDVFLSVTLSIVPLSEVSIVDFPACMLSPMLLEISSKVSVLDCIRCLVCDIKARSSAKSGSSNCSQGVHCTPHFFPFVLSLRIQSTARVKRKGESRWKMGY